MDPGFIEFEKCRAVLKALGCIYDLSKNYFALKSLPKNKDSGIRVADFTKWWLSGRRDLSKLLRFVILTKWRSSAFLAHGIDTFKRDLVASY